MTGRETQRVSGWASGSQAGGQRGQCAGPAVSAIGSEQKAPTAEARGRGSVGRKEGKTGAEGKALPDPGLHERRRQARCAPGGVCVSRHTLPS